MAIDEEAKYKGDESGQRIGSDNHVSDGMRMEKARERRFDHCSAEQRDKQVEKPQRRVPNACNYPRH